MRAQRWAPLRLSERHHASDLWYFEGIYVVLNASGLPSSELLKTGRVQLLHHERPKQHLAWTW